MRKLLLLTFVFLILTQKLSAQSAEFYFNQGIQNSQQKKFQNAIEDFSLALRYDPNNARIYAARALAYSQVGVTKFALEDYDKAIEMSPNSAVLLGNRGALKIKAGQYLDAVKDFERAVALEKNNTWYYMMLAEAKYEALQVCQKLGIQTAYSYFDIVGDYSQSINLDPQNSYALLQRGKARLDSINRSNRIPSLQELKSICEDWRLSATIQLDENEALKLMERYCSEEAMYNIIFEKICINAKQKEYDKDLLGAIKFYTAIIENDKDKNNTYYRKALLERARLYTKNEDFWKANEDYQTLLSLKSKDNFLEAKVYYESALVKAKTSNNIGAKDDFDEAISLGYDQSWVYYERALVKNMLGDRNGACKDWYKALDKGESRAKAKIKEFCRGKRR